MATDKVLEQELVDLGQALERLRVHFQSYFMGLEKRPPQTQREQLERRIRDSALHDVRRSNLKFRFLTLIQKYRTYEVYWDRILREIEEGRFNRDVFARNFPKGPEGRAAAARAKAAMAGAAGAAEAEPDGSEALAASASAEPASAEPAPIGRAPAPNKPAVDPGVVADPDHRLFETWMNARQSLGLAVEGITEAAFRAGLERQRVVQAERLGVNEVAFEVAVKDGKVVLLARAMSRPR